MTSTDIGRSHHRGHTPHSTPPRTFSWKWTPARSISCIRELSVSKQMNLCSLCWTVRFIASLICASGSPANTDRQNHRRHRPIPYLWVGVVGRVIESDSLVEKFYVFVIAEHRPGLLHRHSCPLNTNERFHVRQYLRGFHALWASSCLS